MLMPYYIDYFGGSYLEIANEPILNDLRPCEKCGERKKMLRRAISIAGLPRLMLDCNCDRIGGSGACDC